MSDQSEISSCIEEWDRMSDTNESKFEMKRMKEEIEKMREVNDKLIKEMENKNEENRKIREEKDALYDEVAMLRSKNEESESAFSLEEWMKVRMDIMKMSSGQLLQKTMEVYKNVWEKGVARAKSASFSERKRIAEEILKMEELCEEITTDVSQTNEECFKKIENLLRNDEAINTGKEVNNAKIKDLPIEKFLGTYTVVEGVPLPTVKVESETYYWRTLVIKKANAEGRFEMSWICENGKVRTFSWIPDNVVRDGFRVWIEGNVLLRSKDVGVSRYELTDTGFILNSWHRFYRV